MLLPPSGTVTFLFTDIEGSTKLWESSPESMRSALALHDEIVRASIEANGGYVFKTMGDAFCAAFPTAPEAVAAALDAQLSLAAEEWMVDPPVRARMALHTGAVEKRGGDYFGQSVNRVARLLSAGHGGQTLLSAAVQELVRDGLPAGCTLAYLGDASLKDLARSEQVYQLNHPEIAAAFAPLKTLNSSELPNNLPQQPTSFIGREKELAQVKELLLRQRLLTLVGAGGAGKTRLALQAAADLLDGDGDGVWLVELAPLPDPALVASAVAQALDIQEKAGEPIRKTLTESLKRKNLLLVLDNCEHVLDACCSLASDLLRLCPGVHLLTTSRAPLGAAGEQVFRVPSLTVPTQSPTQPQAYTAELLATFDSVQLFIERAKAVQPAFAVTDANAPAVAHLCAQLDGIPLAIELAAARVRSMAIEQVNARLDSRFKLLTGGSRALLPRQQTLKALIDWSYDLLSEQEKLLLARLSVFAGGWTLEAAEAVCSGDGIEECEALDLLTSLTDKSLAVYDGVTSDEAGECSRYQLLESIRQYARHRLDESGTAQAEASRHRHLIWCLALAEESETRLTGPEVGAWLARLQAEHDNLRAALGWCEQEQREHAEEGLRLAGALWRFWYMRGYWSEGRRWLTALQSAAGSGGGDAAEGALRAKALRAVGILAYSQGDCDLASAAVEESLALQRQLGDRRGVAASLNNLGNMAYDQGDYPAAYKLYAESLKIMRELEDRQGVAASLNNLGNMVYDQGDHAAAERNYAEGLQIQREIGDQQGITMSLNNLGSLACDRGDFTAAWKLHAESLQIKREIGDQQGIAFSLHNLGNVAFARGDYAAARQLQKEGLQIKREMGDQLGIAWSLESSAALAYSQGERERAIGLWGAAAERRERIGAPLAQNERQEMDAKLASARAALGDAAYNAAWAEGQAMTPEQAADCALASLS